MSRPDPIEYAERLYAAIRTASFSPLSFLAFGNAVKDGVELRRMPRIAAEPFMRVVGEMLDLEEESADQEIIDADVSAAVRTPMPIAAESAVSAPPPPPGAARASSNSAGDSTATHSGAGSAGADAECDVGQGRQDREER